MQVYISFPATVADDAAIRVTECITHLDQWMTLNRLKLNADKSQLIWLAWHLAARQAYCDATPIIHVSC